MAGRQRMTRLSGPGQRSVGAEPEVCDHRSAFMSRCVFEKRFSIDGNPHNGFPNGRALLENIDDQGLKDGHIPAQVEFCVTQYFTSFPF